MAKGCCIFTIWTFRNSIKLQCALMIHPLHCSILSWADFFYHRNNYTKMKILIFSCAYTLALLLLWPVLAVVAIWYSLFPNPLDRGLTKWLILILEINEFSYPANHVLYGGWQLNWYWHWKSMKFYESNLSFEHVCSLFFFDVLVTVTFHQVGQKSIFFVVELCSCDDSKHRKQISNGPCLFCPCYSLVEVQLEPDRHCSQRPFWFF